MVLITYNTTSFVLFLCSEVITKYKCYRHALKKAKFSSIIQIMCKKKKSLFIQYQLLCHCMQKKTDLCPSFINTDVYSMCHGSHELGEMASIFLKHFSHFKYCSDKQHKHTYKTSSEDSTYTHIKQALTTVHTHI